MKFLCVLVLGLIATLTFSHSSMAKTTEADASLLWQFSRFKDHVTAVDTAQLIYGIPETDAVMVMAICNAGNDGEVSLSLSANVTVSDKAKVSARIFGTAIDAMAIIPESGEGLAGFGVNLPAHDPLLAKMLSKPGLTYGLKDGAQRTIPLSKGKAPIKKFIQACKSFAALKHAGKTKP